MQQLALLVCIGYIVVLLRSYGGRSPCSGWGGWIALIWVLDSASRPIATWFSGGGGDGGLDSDSYDSGNAVGRNIYITLIVAALVILSRRKVNLAKFARENGAFMVLAVFWGLSAVWSDHPLISFKRWIRDTGSVAMVLIVLTEPNPVAAFRLLFVRCACILIPFSFVLIRYFGELGRVYSKWSGELMYVGVTSHKNSLGMLALTAVFFVSWDFIETLTAPEKTKRSTLMLHGSILLMSAYILHISHSATSLVCTVLGLTVLIAMQFPSLRNNVQKVKVFTIIGGTITLALNGVFDLKGSFLEMIGRDPTLTTRTEVWPILQKFQDSPLLGPGFKSFWAGDRLDTLLENYGIIQAHNGYLETYLNGGLLGVSVLLIFLIAGLFRINARLANTTNFSIVRICIWTMVSVHNFTEASFNSSSALWISLLMVTLEYSAAQKERNEVRSYLPHQAGPAGALS